MSPGKRTKNTAAGRSAAEEPDTFSAAERAAMRERAKEAKSQPNNARSSARKLVLPVFVVALSALVAWSLFVRGDGPFRQHLSPAVELEAGTEARVSAPAELSQSTANPVREAVLTERGDMHGGLAVAVQYDDGTSAVDVGLSLQAPGSGVIVGLQRARTDAQGNCVFARVAPGTWWLRSDLAGVGPTSRVVVHADETTHHRLVLPVQLRIRGHVLDLAGVPIAGARIILAPPATLDHDACEVAVTNLVGAFAVVSGMNPSMIGARAAGHAPSPLQFLEGHTGSVVDGVVLRLSNRAGEIQGHVRGPGGQPIEAATVRIGDGRMDAIQPTDGFAPPVPAQVESDESGAYVADGIASGSHAVVVRKLGFATWRGRCEVQPGQTTTLDVQLLEGGRVSGVVRIPGGQPISDATVTTGGIGDLAFTKMVTQADGKYGFDDLEPGECVITAAHREYGQTFVKVQCDDGKKVVQDIELQPGIVVHGRVLSMDGKPILAHVSAFQQEPKPWGWDALARRSDGRFWIAGAPAGLVHMRVDGPSIVDREFRRIDPTQGEVVLHVEVKPEPTAMIRGTVLDPDGKPVFLGDVTALTMEGPRKVRVVSGKVRSPSGTFELGPMPPDTYEVRIDCSGFPKYSSEPRTLLPYQEWDLGTVQLVKPGWIRATFPAGRPDELRIEIWGDRREWLGDIASSGLSPPLTAGPYVLRVHAPGHGEFARAVELAPGATAEVEIAMVRGFACRLELQRTDASRWQRMFVEVARAGETGSYRPRVFPESETVFVDERTLRSGPHKVRVAIEGRTILAPIVVEERQDVQVFSIAIDG